MCASCQPSWLRRFLTTRLVHSGSSMAAFAEMRAKIVSQASGVVVEVGFGSGLNLPFYDPAKAKRVIAVDPDAEMLRLSRRQPTPVALEIVEAGGENLPMSDDIADTVVVTYSLCTIPDPKTALDEVRRILKPGGRLLFIEHGCAETRLLGSLQIMLDGLWNRLAGGCHLTRDPIRLILDAGFLIRHLERRRFPLHLRQLGMHCAGTAIHSDPRTSSASPIDTPARHEISDGAAERCGGSQPGSKDAGARLKLSIFSVLRRHRQAWVRTARARTSLHLMSDRQLKDIGICRTDIHAAVEIAGRRSPD